MEDVIIKRQERTITNIFKDKTIRVKKDNFINDSIETNEICCKGFSYK